MFEIQMKFSKKHQATGDEIINSMRPLYHYSVSRPDAILFSAHASSDKLFSADDFNEILRNLVREKKDAHPQATPFEIYQRPMDYNNHDSGKFEIPAVYWKVFFSALKQFKRSHSDFVIKTVEYDDLVSNLKESGYVPDKNAGELTALGQDICTMTIEDRETEAKKQKSYEKALEIARFYFTNNKYYYAHEAALQWLNRAYTWAPSNVDLKLLLTTEFVECTRSIYNGAFLFSNEFAKMREIIANNCPIEMITFGKFFNKSSVNEALSKFLISTKTLKELKLSTTWSANVSDRLTDHEASFIAKGLSENTSLEKLDISDQMISDKGMAEIQSAVDGNQFSKLQSIHTFGTGAKTGFRAR